MLVFKESYNTIGAKFHVAKYIHIPPPPPHPDTPGWIYVDTLLSCSLVHMDLGTHRDLGSPYILPSSEDVFK